MDEFTNGIVSIVIVTCGKWEYLASCLDSIKKQSYRNLEIIVVNNIHSEKIEVDLPVRFPGVHLLSNFKQPFYCQALNLGISHASGEFILCLNDDVILDDQFVNEARKGFSISEKIGMVSGKILRKDAQTLDSTGLFLSLSRTARERGYGKEDSARYNKEGSIFGVNGAVAFYRKKMLEEIKEGSYFDPVYRIFFEDLDIAWRAQRHGWKGYYMPKAIAYHVRGGTSRNAEGIDKPFARKYMSDEFNLYLLRNWYLTIIKNESCVGLLLHVPFIAAYELMAWTYIITCRPRLIKEFVRNTHHLRNALLARFQWSPSA